VKTNLILLISIIITSVFIMIACGDKGVPYDEAPELQANIEVLSDTLVESVVYTLLDTLVVRVVDGVGNPVPGNDVIFNQITAINGGDFKWDTVQTTNDLGVARMWYSCDSLVGTDSIMITAVGGVDSIAYIVINTIPGDPILNIYSGNGQFSGAIAGEPLPDSCVVLVSDRFNNPIADQRIKFKSLYRSIVVTDSSGEREMDTAMARTDENGLAACEWILQVDNVTTPVMQSYLMSGDSPDDSVTFSAAIFAASPYKYYYSIQPIFEDNCYLCHTALDDYAVNFYWSLLENGNLVPGDGNSVLVQNADADHNLNNINYVEEDKVYRWVVSNNAQPGASGLQNYTDHIKSIIDGSCALIGCHTGATPDGDYDMSTHEGIRGNGTDVIANAIPGDSSSALVQSILSGGDMCTYLGIDEATRAVRADSIIEWIFVDSLRQY